MIGNGRPVFSVECFPPKTDEGRENLLATARDLAGASTLVLRSGKKSYALARFV